MLRLKILLFILFLSACAHKKQNEQATCDDLTPEQVNQISMLAKTSYIRGCVDGMNMLDKRTTEGKRLNACKMQSINHYMEIKGILKADLKPTPDQVKKPNQE